MGYEVIVILKQARVIISFMITKCKHKAQRVYKSTFCAYKSGHKSGLRLHILTMDDGDK